MLLAAMRLPTLTSCHAFEQKWGWRLSKITTDSLQFGGFPIKQTTVGRCAVLLYCYTLLAVCHFSETNKRSKFTRTRANQLTRNSKQTRTCAFAYLALWKWRPLAVNTPWTVIIQIWNCRKRTFKVSEFWIMLTTSAKCIKSVNYVNEEQK